jgi:hypothetical protein
LIENMVFYAAEPCTWDCAHARSYSNTCTPEHV